MSERETRREPRPSQNAFVLQVIAAFKQFSPEMKVRDLEQPSHGSLKREEQKASSRPVCTLQDKAKIVLMCKALRNEELRPASTSAIDLNCISTSSLMQRRKPNRSLT